jgi:hypothetical protein
VFELLRLLLAGLVFLTGTASQYAPGLMEKVVANRQAGRTAYDLPDPLPEVDGYAAVLDCEEIGSVWLVRPQGGEWERLLVADCAGSQLRADGLTGGEWMRANGVLLEVDYRTAVRWNTVGRGIGVEVLKARR